MKNKYHIGLKTLLEKEKLLFTSNFSFPHNVFHSYKSLVRQIAALCGNGLNTLGKEETSIVSFFWKMFSAASHTFPSFYNPK